MRAGPAARSVGRAGLGQPGRPLSFARTVSPRDRRASRGVSAALVRPDTRPKRAGYLFDSRCSSTAAGRQKYWIWVAETRSRSTGRRRYKGVYHERKFSTTRSDHGGNQLQARGAASRLQGESGGHPVRHQRVQSRDDEGAACPSRSSIR